MMLLLSKTYTPFLGDGTINSPIFNDINGVLYFNKYLIYFKIVFVLFLFILHINFLFSNDPALEESIDCKQSVISNLKQIIKEYSGIFITIAGVYTAQLNYSSAISQEERVKEIAKTDKHFERCEELHVEEGVLVTKIKESNITLKEANMKFEQVLLNLNDTKDSYSEVKKISFDIKNVVSKLTNSDDSYEKTLLSIQLQEKSLALDNIVKAIIQSATSSQELLDQISNIINPSHSLDMSENPIKGNKSDEVLKIEDIKKSSIINLDSSEDWFNNLTVIKQIAATLILSHTILISALINIIFIYYGDFLIEKYNLKERYPKLNKIIEYRRKFSKFYFLNSCFFIFIISIVYISFGISILST